MKYYSIPKLIQSKLTDITSQDMNHYRFVLIKQNS